MIYTILALMLIMVAFGLSAFFSGAEIGLISANRVRIKHLAETGVGRAQIMEGLYRYYPQLIVAFLVGNNIANVTIAATAASFFERYQSITAVIVTGFILIFGEIIPKSLFRRHATKLVLLLAWPIKASYFLLYPLVGLFCRLLNISEREETSYLTREELKFLIEEGGRKGVLEEEEEMLTGAFELSTTRVKEVMTPRVDMVSLKAESDMNEILQVISEHNHSRIPVCGEDIDDVLGILYTKDLLNFWGEEPSEVRAIEFNRIPYFVPESKPVGKLLREFQEKRTHVAIVVDEYGGTAGLVTLEDLLEELVGEIEDEYVHGDEVELKVIDESTYEADARVSIDQLSEELNLDLPEDDYETVGGFILHHLGRIPHSGEIIEIGELGFHILDADEKSILKVKIIKQ
ncbi:MAG: hemolysin family protein [bacterium]|nr:hemolysin family protein [bacterium]